MQALHDDDSKFDLRMVSLIYFAFVNLAQTSAEVTIQVVNNTHLLECTAFLLHKAKGIDGDLAGYLAIFTKIICQSVVLNEKGIEYVIDTIHPLMVFPHDQA